MTVRRRPTMAGDMLEHRQNAAGHQAVGHGCGDGGDLGGIGAIGTVADHIVRSCRRHVRQWQAVDVDAERGKISRDQPRAEPGRPQPFRLVAIEKRAIGRARRIDRPMRRPQPLHPSAFLVDQDGRTCIARCIEKISSQVS